MDPSEIPNSFASAEQASAWLDVLAARATEPVPANAASRTLVAATNYGIHKQLGHRPAPELVRQIARHGVGPVLYLGGPGDRERSVELRWLPEAFGTDTLLADEPPVWLGCVPTSPVDAVIRGWWCEATPETPYGLRFAHTAAETASLVRLVSVARLLAASTGAAAGADLPLGDKKRFLRESDELTAVADRHEGYLPEQSAPWLARAQAAAVAAGEKQSPTSRPRMRAASLRN